MAAKDNIGDQFIPEEHRDWAWEVTLQPHLDQEYTRKDGSPEIRPGHLHFDKEGNPHYASSLCAGRHACPAPTQRMREALAMNRWGLIEGF